MIVWRTSTEEGGVVVTHGCQRERCDWVRSQARGSIPLCALYGHRQYNHRQGARNEESDALIRKSSSCRPRNAQSEEAVRALRREGGQAVQIGVPCRLLVKQEDQ